MGQFKPMPKMETTEPSVELKLKKGGRAGKKMAMGGAPTMGMPVAPRRRMAMGQQPMMMRKDGGHIANEKAEMKRVKAEIAADRKEERNEHKEISRVKGELKSHEKMKASKAHQGLKNGGAPKAGPNVVGGLEGGLEATRPMKSKTTGGVRAPGYKNGGALNAKGMALAKHYETNINDDSSPKKVSGKTGGVSDTTAGGRPAGYKKGGSMKKYASGGMAAKGMAIANKYQTKMNSGDPMPTVKGSTKGVKVGPAGYKDGGHVAMTCKSTGGYTAMKKMQKC
jgi:hypothetical protein